MTELLDIIIKSNTLNFFIVVIVITFILYKLNVKQKIENVRSDIKSYVDTSAIEKELAQKELAKSQESINKLPSDIQSIQRDTKNSVSNIELKITSEIQEQKADLKNNALRLLNLERKKFNSKLINILSEKSVELARKNAIKQLNLNKDLHNIYIDEAVKELEKIKL